MKVVFLTPTLEMHGGNIIMLRYADVLLKNGFDVTIITTDKPVAFSLDKRIKVIKYPRVRIKYLDFFFFQLVYLRKIIRLMKDSDFVIPIYFPLVVHAILAKKIRGFKYKIIPLFQDSLITLWVGPYIRFLLRNNFISRNIDFMFYVSKIVSKYLGNTSYKKYFLPNGVDLREFDFDLKRPKKNYILFVGRSNKPKGFDIFCKALKLIKAKHPEIDGCAISPDNFDKYENSIHFIKYKDRKQLSLLYQDAMVYVSSSRAESFPLPPLEAMASGTPVIMTRTGGEINYAKNNSNCLLVNNEDSMGIYNAFNKLMNNSKLKTKLIMNGWRTVEKFEWKKSEESFLKVLLDLDKNVYN